MFLTYTLKNFLFIFIIPLFCYFPIHVVKNTQVKNMGLMKNVIFLKRDIRRQSTDAKQLFYKPSIIFKYYWK